jgi:hypothetical protein
MAYGNVYSYGVKKCIFNLKVNTVNPFVYVKLVRKPQVVLNQQSPFKLDLVFATLNVD